MRSRVMILPTIFGFVSGALVLVYVWSPLAAATFPRGLIATGSASVVLWSLLIGLSLAVAVFCLSKSPKTWAACSSLIVGGLIVGIGLTMVSHLFRPGYVSLWRPITVLLLAGTSQIVSGILRIRMKLA